MQWKNTARLAFNIFHLWPRIDVYLTPRFNPMTCLSKKKNNTQNFQGLERSWKKLKSRSTLPLPWRDRSAACPFLAISISWWLKIHFALTVNSPLANSFSPAHGVGVHGSLEATRDSTWPVRVQIHWRKSKNNRSNHAAVGFTWSSSQNLLSGNRWLKWLKQMTLKWLPPFPGPCGLCINFWIYSSFQTKSKELHWILNSD